MHRTSKKSMSSIHSTSDKSGASDHHPTEGESPLATLKVQILGCSNLPSADFIGESDPFVTLEFGGMRRKTPVIKNQLNPRWQDKDATFEFPIYGSAIHTRGAYLNLVVWDKDMIGKDYLGELSLQPTQWFRKEGDNGVATVLAFNDPSNNPLSYPLTKVRSHKYRHNDPKPNDGPPSIRIKIGLVPLYHLIQQEAGSSSIDLTTLFEKILHEEELAIALLEGTHHNVLAGSPSWGFGSIFTSPLNHRSKLITLELNSGEHSVGLKFLIKHFTSGIKNSVVREADKYREMIRRKELEMKDSEEYLAVIVVDVERWKASAETAQQMIVSLNTELDADRNAIQALETQKQENHSLKETIDLLRLELDQLRGVKSGIEGQQPKIYSEASAQYTTFDFVASKSSQTEPEPGRVTQSMEIQTEVEKPPGTYDVPGPSQLPPPPPYAHLLKEERRKIGMEELAKWHSGIHSLEPVPNGISGDTVEEWSRVKEELGVTCTAIDEIVQRSETRGPRVNREPIIEREKSFGGMRGMMGVLFGATIFGMIFLTTGRTLHPTGLTRDQRLWAIYNDVARAGLMDGWLTHAAVAPTWAVLRNLHPAHALLSWVA